MAIRVFACLWTEQQQGSTLYITNPIDDHLTDVSLSAPVVGQNYYARLSQAKRPDKLFMLKVMRGNLQPAEWDTLAALPNTQMVPAGAFDRTINSVPASIRNRVYQMLDALGVPRTVWTSAATVGGFLRNLLIELNSEQSGFGQWELDAAEWA